MLGQLLTNGIIFNRSGGLVKIVVDGGEKFVRVSVADTGFGIKPDEINLLFEPFSQLRHPEVISRGTGLGLTIAKSLIEEMGGEIEVSSQLHEGSTFTLILPRYRSNASL